MGEAPPAQRDDPFNGRERSPSAVWADISALWTLSGTFESEARECFYSPFIIDELNGPDSSTGKDEKHTRRLFAWERLFAFIWFSQFGQHVQILSVATGETAGQHRTQERLWAHTLVFSRGAARRWWRCTRRGFGTRFKAFQRPTHVLALLLPRASSSKTCRTGIISTSRGNNTIINTYFMWKKKRSNRWHLDPSCSFDNHTSASADERERQVGHSLLL